MRKKLLRMMFLTIGLVIGTSVAKGAVGYSTITDNVDNTKQDVTYTFNDVNNYNSEGVKVNTTNVGTVMNGTSAMNLFQCSTDGLDRLAFDQASGASPSTWWWRMATNGKGVQLRNGTHGFAILNLKKGDVVTIYLNNPANYKFPGATSVGDGTTTTTQTPNSGTNEGNYTVTTVTGKSITITMTSDGNACSLVTYNQSGYITKIVITEAKPAAAVPTGEITKVSGINRTVSLSTTTTSGEIYYTTDGTDPTSASTKYDATKGIGISQTTTIKAVTVANGVTSGIYSESFEAGTEVSLANTVITKAKFTTIGNYSYVTYKATCDNSSVLLKPTATFTATYTPTSGTASEVTLPYTATEPGVLAVTASADGYTSTSASETVTQTKYLKSYNFDATSIVVNSDAADGTNATNVSNATTTGTKYCWFYNLTSCTYSLNSSITTSGLMACAINGSKTPVYGLYARLGDGTVKFTLNDGEYIEFDNNTDNTVIDALPSTSHTLGKYSLVSAINIYTPVTTTETLNVSNAGYATYCSASALDFSETTDVTAYTASYDETTKTVTFTPISGIVPQGTGLLLKSSNNGATTATVNAINPSINTTDVSGNLLKGVTAATEIEATDGTNTNLVLLKGAKGVGFYKLTSNANGADFTVSANTAYLAIPSTSFANSFVAVNPNDVVSGISGVSPVAKNAAKYYSLTGVEVAQPAKGLYIQNGKKVIVK